MTQNETRVTAIEEWMTTQSRETGSRSRTAVVRELPLDREATSEECRDLLLAHLDFIDRTVGSVARRYALNEWEADDLASQVKLRLLSEDFAVLRKFQGKSRLTTYLTTVIHNMFRDYRIQQWGKWRPSAAAKRAGDLGVQMEALLYRDRYSFDEAVEMLRTRYEVQASLEELVEIASTIKPRTTRRFETDSVLSRLEADDRGDQRVRDGERAELQERVADALKAALAALEAEDRLIVNLRFVEGLTIRSIASTLDLDQRRIYARVRRVLGEVREQIAETGLSSGEILDLLDWPACAVEAGLTGVFPLLSSETA